MRYEKISSRLTRRRILQGSAAMAAASLLSSCGGSTSPASGTTQQPTTPTNPQPVPSGPLTVVTLTVSATVAGAIGQRFIGFSFAKTTIYSQNYSLSNTQMMGLLSLLPPGILRANGTECLSCSTWEPNGAGSTQYQIAPSDVSRYAAFLQATGWQSIYGINMSNYYSSPQSQTVANAVNEAEYVYGALGSSLYGIEIANEPELYYEQTNAATGYMANLPNGTNYSVTNYEATWILFYNGIRAALPTVPIVGPGTGIVTTWASPFASYAGTKLNALTAHYYRDYLQSASDTAQWLTTYPDTSLNGIATGMQTAAKSAGIPWRMDEGNSSDNTTLSGIADGFGSALWALDLLFTLAQNGATGMNFMTTNGEAAGSYSPFTYLDPGSGIYAVHPEFYALVLFGMAGQGSLYTTAFSGLGSLNITAYAVKTSTGLNLVIVNKDPVQNLQLTIDLPQTVHTATLLALTQLTSGASGPSVTATSGVTIQGGTIGLNGSFTPAAAYGLSYNGAQVSCYVPFYSAVLIQIT